MVRFVVPLLVMAALGLFPGCYHPITSGERRVSFQPYAGTTIAGTSAAEFLLRRTALLVNEGGGVGSATAIDRRGYFLTAAHCVGKDVVRLVVGRDAYHTTVVPARVVWRGDLTQGGPDLALLRTAWPIAHAFEWAPAVTVGQPVLVCGPDYEEGVERTFQLDCLAGRVKTTGRKCGTRDGKDGGAPGGGGAASARPPPTEGEWGEVEEFRHDAPVHHGDSGGPVVGLDGRLIGINFATVRLVFLPSIAMRVGVNASRPDLGWLASLIEADDASFRGRAERHSRDHEPESITAERP
jgi:S1-C subfamily serine protease